MAFIFVIAGVRTFVLVVVTVFFSFSASAQVDPAKAQFAGKDRMSGYSLKDFPDFQKEWHFVTVRYRKDTGEMRWTYANDLAWKALLDGGTEYPDGSIFAKIGLITQEDPDFVSSAVPSGAKRFQLMVKDKKKHAETDGWGYALFDHMGKTFPDDPQEQVMACHACHAVVPHRDYVFSQPINLNIDTMAAFARAPIAAGHIPGMSFETVSIAELPDKVRGVLPEGVEHVRMLQGGSLRAHMFQGTIDEIRPMLAKEALASKLPAALVNVMGDRFSLVLPGYKETKDCSAPERFKAVKLTAHYTITLDNSKTYPLAVMEFCDTMSSEQK